MIQFPFLVLAFFNSSFEELISGRFTEIQPEIRPEVTPKVWKTMDVTDGFPRWRLIQTRYNWMLDSTRRVRRATFLYPCYPRNPW
jgi:hypothetical protein